MEAQKTKRLYAGNTSHLYEVQSDWLQVPSNVELGYTHGIVTDKNDRVFIFHTGKPSVLVFESNGSFVTAWGEDFAGGAHGFYLHQESNGEFLYVTDTKQGVVVKTTLTGEKLLTIGAPDRPDIYDAERKYVPTDVAVAPNGDIYVSDGYGQSWVHQFTADGEYLRSWGGKGSELGQFKCPHGISIDLRRSEPEIYVADRGNHRIQVFTLDGLFIRSLDDDLDMPCSFFFHGEEMYIPDLHSRVSIFDGHDRLVAHLGEDRQAKQQEGWPNISKSYYRSNKLSSPHGVCVDSQSNVYIAEWVIDGRITKLVRVQNN
ncbi:hypothetical protein [Paenibacillus qinlingensis]|uniref:hypothetical protein n=1 Tax=Paenibacillus qinlingensis TaxID=1837343 RepID=UPI001FE7F1D3|nr:hypothetical protein [Paenibacillus qinlingensis]